MEQIKIDLLPSGVMANAHASQYDIGRTIKFYLTDEGEAYTLAGTEVITMTLRKPDGSDDTFSLTNTSSNYVEWTTDDGDLNLSGAYLVEITITSGSDVLGTANFTLNTEIDPISGKAVVLMATGNPVHFNTDLGGILVDCECELPYKADGYTSARVINSATSPVLDQTPYLSRPLPPNAGNRLLDMIVGGTVAFNQVVNTGDTSINTVSGHKYYTKINSVESIINGGSAVSINDSSVDMVIDLTALFGSSTIADYVYSLESGTAGAGINWLKAHGFIAKDYYAYNSGTLVSVKPTKHIEIGKNQWNGETKHGYIYNGNYYASDSYWCNKNDIAVLPSTDYCFSGITTGGQICFYDSNKIYLSYVETAINKTFTTPTNCYYISIYNPIATENNDKMLEFGSTPTAYEPYTKHEYTLNGGDLYGLFKLDANNKLYADGNTYKASGEVGLRYGIVDLGDLTYIYNAYFHEFFAPLPDCKFTGSGSFIGVDCICSNYQAVKTRWDTFTDGMISCGSDTMGANVPYVNICDYSFSDANAFKTAMNGVYLVYELATTTTTTADPFTNPQVCENGGSEEYTDTREYAVPVGHESVYGMDMTVNEAEFGVTVYGGSIDFTTGELISDKNPDGTDKSPADEFFLTPISVPVREGDNYIITDADGTNTVKYFKKG